MEAKKQGTGEEDLSMEEILQSIRRIIADDETGDKPKGADPVDASPAPSDILELTDMIEDDGSITDLKETQAATPEQSSQTADVLGNIDAALAPPPPEPKPEPEPALQEPPAPAPAIEIPAPAPQTAKPEEENLDALLSKAAEAATISALSKLPVPEQRQPHQPTPSPSFRSGTTVEDLVEEMLRPMMKEWLDNNLPEIVETIVEREVQRLTRR